MSLCGHTGGRRFNAILATASINDAIEYHALFKTMQAEKQAADPDFKPLNIACVFSPPAEGDPDVKQIQEDLPQEQADNEEDPEGKKAALKSILADYNARYGTNHRLSEFDLYYQDVQKRIKDQQWPNADYPPAQKIDITIVVDMLLTGFDSKFLNTLYVDKNLKHHGLIQAFLIGLAPSSHRIARAFTMGAQYAYWRDYARHKRIGMFLKWHVFMPALTALCGYFPGGRLGWLEDTPRGVVRDWVARHPRFEENWRRAPVRLSEAERRELVERFAALRADTLAISLSDDEFGTVEAIQRLLGYYRNSPRTHLHLTPKAIGEAQVGHFAFFHSRFEHSLWQLPLEWLRHGRLPEAPEGEVVTLAPEAVRGAAPAYARWRT